MRLMRFLTLDLERTKVVGMEPEPNDEPVESRDQGTQEPQESTIPLSRLRDLRPEKDPIGAGRSHVPKRTPSAPNERRHK